ncbi:sensor domain-containing protein [Vreelandella arcis]|uniref:PAS domain S-box-containing protein/diguanylate cyclase (GGDEF) domain-containing protein n=1 Tax=Vreelandella arcis TaxID=416873 RepID=A0A1G9X1E1_9GAMM|nr:bifunctional diguanylate cyclase/phosphodiesterase [Halomonas arcis]SDM90564.1 PAS domain S-box-containing protein/diguanylate cyclase (GGDEF) domain-containing protein [Halomonas arcis]
MTPSFRSLMPAAATQTAAILALHRLEAHHHALFESYPEGLFELDPLGKLLRWNTRLLSVLDKTETEITGLSYLSLLPVFYHSLMQRAFKAACTGKAQSFHCKTTSALGNSQWLVLTLVAVFEQDKVVSVYGRCLEINQYPFGESQRHLLTQVIEASPNGMVVADATQPGLPLIYVNEAFTCLTGYTRQEVLGQNCRFLQGEDTSPSAIQEIRRAIAHCKTVKVVLLNYRRDNTPFWNQFTLTPVINPQGVCTHFIGAQEDITHQREQEARIAHQASHDSLTGLPNLGSLQMHLEQVFLDKTRLNQHLVLFYIDLDDFKPINDAFGHTVGDKLLKTISQRLRQLIRSDDLVARLSSDEFVIMLTGYPSEQAVINLAHRLLSAIAEPFTLDSLCLHISASIGIASERGGAARPQELLHHANLAMQDAKRQGRNTWQWYCGENVDNVAEHVIIRRELHEAIHDNQLAAYYQPIVAAQDSTICCVEALIRWHHPTRGLLSPGHFMPIAEQTGQIIAIGQWVLERACRDIAELNRESTQPLKVAVNISPMQFQRGGFLTELESALEKSGLPPRLLELEVTESTLMCNTDQAITLLDQVRALGVSVALDDFGTGFSSLGYLRDLPINKVKLDRLFIREIAHNPKNAAIVQGVITMAHHLNLVVVAEGIETPEEQNDLRQRQCDLLQGFLFSRPIPFRELKRLPHQLDKR